MANLIKKICTKLYHNRPRYVQDMRKTIWCVFSVYSDMWDAKRLAQDIAGDHY